MDDTPQPNLPPDAIGLLDILVTLAENIKLLVLGPLTVGLLALGISFFRQQTFESVAVLQAEPAVASLMTTAGVLDPVAEKLGLSKNGTPEDARQDLRGRIKTSVGRNDKLITLTVSGQTPEQAQTTAKALLIQTYAQSQPKGSQKARLKRQLAEAEARMKTAQVLAVQLSESFLRGTSTAMPKRSDTLEFLTGGSAGLLEASATAQKQIVELEIILEGVTEDQLVQAPTMPEKAVAPKKGIAAVMSALATGFLLISLVFIRSSLQNLKDEESLTKLKRLKRSLGFRD